MATLSYHEQKDIENTKKLRELQKELPYFCTDFFRGMCMGDQLLVGGHIRPKIAGIKERRGTDPHMNLLCSGFFHHCNDVGDGCSADNGIIHQNQPFSSDHRFQNTELHLDAGLPFLLARLDKRPADITVFVKSKSKWNTGSLRIAFCRRQSRIRNANYKVRIHRIGFCQKPAGPDP